MRTNWLALFFLDLSKAFDMMDHSILLRKLAKYGVVGRELEWFVGYLSGQKQRVCVRDAKSKWIEVQRGVPQGSILGPPFFIVYVNDLPQVIQNSAVTQYANDTTMTLVTNDVNLMVIDTLTLHIFPLSPLPAEQ